MKNIILSISFLVSFSMCGNAKSNSKSEKFGKTLNIGVGAVYYGYINQPLPVVSLNYEFDVVRNFTLAPFITFYSYHKDYYWGNNNHPYKYYSYYERAIPIGVKGTYYFDQLLHANSKWDFYAAGSLGFILRDKSWEEGYYGDNNVFDRPPLYIDAHIGSEYHLNKKIGFYLDLSTGISSVGLAIHL